MQCMLQVAGALVGKNGDPQTGWMKEGVLEQRGCSFQVDKFQQLSTNQGLICIVSDVGVPELVSWIKGPASQGWELVFFQLEAFRTYGERQNKRGVHISGGPHLGVPLYPVKREEVLPLDRVSTANAFPYRGDSWCKVGPCVHLRTLMVSGYSFLVVAVTGSSFAAVVHSLLALWILVALQ